MSDLFDKYGHPIRVLIDPDCPSDLFDKSGRPHIVVETADGIDLSTGEFLAALLKGGNLLHIPTNAGWTETVVGSGVVSQEPTRHYVNTAGSAESEAILSAAFLGFNADVDLDHINWGKKLYVMLNYTRLGSCATAIARLQIKTVATRGALAAKGIGIRLDNLVLKGESYGTALGVIDLATALASSRMVRIVIIHYPASKIEWYVNGVLKGTQSTINNIPSGDDDVFIVHSIINQVTASGAVSILHHPKVWQEI